jgi:hypothetical protein
MNKEYNDTEGYDDSDRYDKLEDNVYIDNETDETVIVLTPEERAMSRNFRRFAIDQDD